MAAIHRLSRFVLDLRFSLTSFRGGESAFIDCVVLATIVRNRIALWCRVFHCPAISISTCNIGQLDLAKKRKKHIISSRAGLMNACRIYKFIAISCLNVEYQYQYAFQGKDKQERGPVNCVE